MGAETKRKVYVETGEKERVSMPPTTSTVVMVRPDYFRYNPQTAPSNKFQVPPVAPPEIVRQEALREFGGMVNTLEANGIEVLSLDSPKGVVTPDAVFPNNWFYTDNMGRLVVFPMRTPNRRIERQVDALGTTLAESGFEVNQVLDLTHYEKHDQFLEGTGSMVLSRQHGVAFAIGSPRTDEEAFHDFCDECGYMPVFFHAKDREGSEIYHTNVIMAIGDGFTVLCEESIRDQTERKNVLDIAYQMNPVLIPISLEQVGQFCGNLLNLRSKEGASKIVMSQTSLEAFTGEQRTELMKHGDIV
ncbi:hypothetical protein COT62_03190, partial [Candidatus Roizmanbacteria bacterium CG09_land_8_20_14_0_10_41_9]